MEPTIRRNEVVFADMQVFRNTPPQRGDVVVYRTAEDLVLAKRVIALEGDTIEGRAKQIFLNGKLVHETYIQHTFGSAGVKDSAFLDDFGPVTVPSGCLFIMGDNRDVSYDSRHPDVGPIAIGAVRGKVLQIVRSPYPGRSGTRIRSIPPQ